MSRQRVLAILNIRYDQQRKWMYECGGDRLGYQVHYGCDENEKGRYDNANSLYDADEAELQRIGAELRVTELLLRQDVLIARTETDNEEANRQMLRNQARKVQEEEGMLTPPLALIQIGLATIGNITYYGWECPACHRVVEVPKHYEGDTVQCSKCHARFLCEEDS